MATAVKMPQLGESVVEGTIARWLKQPGDAVEKLEPLLEISTDKIDTEVPAPASGTLLAVLAVVGETVNAGAVVAYIGSPDEVPPATTERAPAVTPPPSGVEYRPAEPPAPPAEDDAPEAPSPSATGGRGFVSPVVARIAAEHDVDLEQVTGSGLNERVTKKDILAFIAARDAAAAEPRLRSEAAGLKAETDVESADGATVLRPLSNMRRLIAEHMVESKRTSPHVTTVMEVDMTGVVRHREEAKRAFAEREIALTFTAYFMAAAAAALLKVPEANSHFTEHGIELYRRIHIGMAVAVKQGLLVPVLRDVDEMSLQGIARTIRELARRARAGKLLPDELQGGTFTITNHGTAGSLVATPIINQPQAAILGTGAIVKRPVVQSSSTSLLPSADDAIVIRPMCYLSLTFDHRVLDGATADQFLGSVKSTLEAWR